jgi:hypothetical protein
MHIICKIVYWSQNQVGTQTVLSSMRRMGTKPAITPTSQYLLSRAMPDAHDQSDGESLGTGWAWESYMEYVGVRGNGTVVTNSLLEQISTTKDSTDYLWYTTR